MTDVRYQTIKIWNDKINLRVQIKGDGPPLLYLHPAGGMGWDPFLDHLATTSTVYAPEFPGTTPGDIGAIHQLDDIFDVVLAYEEAARALGAIHCPIVGQSFGGMLAAELASSFPDLFTKVVLLDPAGLWLDDHPVNMGAIMAGPPELLGTTLFHDLGCPGAQAFFAPPPDPAMGLDIIAQLVWTIGCTAKFLWPIPDRGLRKRLHRVTAPTLIMWGKQDALIPVAHGHEFARLITHSQLKLVDNCGHIPQVEQPATTIEAVQAFLNE
jgi:pimeloyl-ACP methyl ester carboxylesterase